MGNKEFLEDLEKIISKEKIKLDEPMKKHTSFKIGGPAEIFVIIDTIEELKEILKISKKNNVPITVIGNGSNILVTEKGIKGIVIKLNLKEIKIEQKKEIVATVDSGVQLMLFARKLFQEEISGFEELSAIPGTIGGAIVMNAGAHEKEIKDIVTQIKVMDYDGNIHIFTKEQAQFEYRKSIFSSGKYIILQVEFLLEKGNGKDIYKKMTQYTEYRKEKQPIEYPSAGSTFKRGNNFITAKLIDEVGLKGYTIGGAQISEKHAGFIINKGNATSKDVIDLIKYTQDTVYKKFGKKIELEIKILGE